MTKQQKELIRSFIGELYSADGTFVGGMFRNAGSIVVRKPAQSGGWLEPSSTHAAADFVRAGGLQVSESRSVKCFQLVAR